MKLTIEEIPDPRGQPPCTVCARHAAGLSQAKLAQAAGIPITTLQNVEYDRREPLVGTAAKIAKGLGVSLDVLTGAAIEKPKRNRGK